MVVPKSGKFKGWGWTINFAHPKAWWTLLLSFVIAVGPGLISIALLMPLVQTNKISVQLAIGIQTAVLTLTIIFIIASCRSYGEKFK